jgi:uncharacterized tellurite resistance protein B-like protein
MTGFLDQFRTRVLHSLRQENPAPPSPNVDDKLALGVLLWVVAEADHKFLPEEKDEIRTVLEKAGAVSPQDMPYLLGAIETAARERIDLYTFTREVSKDLPYEVKKGIVDQLFRVACADGNLAYEEQETIRKISGLCGIDHKDFIASKLKIKKESGLSGGDDAP